MPAKDIQRQVQGNNGSPLVATFSKADTEGNEVDFFRPKPLPGYEFILPFLYNYFGDLKEIAPIYFMASDVDNIFSYWYEGYEDGQLQQRCDGENRVNWLGDDGHHHNKTLPCLKRTEVGGCNCTLKNRLHFRLPHIERATGVLGRYLITSGSRNDARHILSTIQRAQETFEPLGYKLFEIPFIVWREKETVKTRDGKGGYGEASPILVKLRVDPDFVKKVIPKPTKRERQPAGYLPYLIQQFQRHLPDYTVDDLSSYYGMSTPDFLETYPHISDVRDKVIDWVINSDIALQVYRVKTKRPGKQYRYHLSTGFKDVTMYSAQLFRDVEIDTSEFYRKLNAVKVFDKPIYVYLGKTKSKGNVIVKEILTRLILI